MIYPDFEASSHQMLLEMFERVNDGEQLFPHDAMVSYLLIEHLTCISNNLHAILHLEWKRIIFSPHCKQSSLHPHVYRVSQWKELQNVHNYFCNHQEFWGLLFASIRMFEGLIKHVELSHMLIFSSMQDVLLAVSKVWFIDLFFSCFHIM